MTERYRKQEISFASERSKKTKQAMSELNSKNNSRKNSKNNSLLGSDEGFGLHKKRFSIGSAKQESSSKKSKGSKNSSVALVEVSKPSRNAKPIKQSNSKNSKKAKNLTETQESKKAQEMIHMIDLVEAEQSNLHGEKALGMQPYADGSEKFKQSKESQDTLEKTTK